MDNSWIGCGVHNPDLKHWGDYIGVNERKMEVWCEIIEAWETDDEASSDDEEMKELEKRARQSVKLHKRPFDKVERELRAETPDWPDWVTRMWFYLSTTDEGRESQIAKLEKDLHSRTKTKKRKASREKLFKRLNSSSKRFRK